MHHYLEKILEIFNRHKNVEHASGMKQYMKGQFEYLGVAASTRKDITAPFFRKANLPPIEEVPKIIQDIWDQPYREVLYTGVNLVTRFAKKCPESWINMYEWMITTHSWWDTVDLISSNLVGPYFKSYPDIRDFYIEKWLTSENIWLQRTSILYQLKYGAEVNIDVLEKTIIYCKTSNEFFLRKAIGWALRQYGKFNPEYVKNFIERNPDLSNLSKREALKHLT